MVSVTNQIRCPSVCKKRSRPEAYLPKQVLTSLDPNRDTFNPYRTTDVLIFNMRNMDHKTREIVPLNGISLPDIHMDLWSRYMNKTWIVLKPIFPCKIRRDL